RDHAAARGEGRDQKAQERRVVVDGQHPERGGRSHGVLSEAHFPDTIWFRKSIHWRVSTPSSGTLGPSSFCGTFCPVFFVAAAAAGAAACFSPTTTGFVAGAIGLAGAAIGFSGASTGLIAGTMRLGVGVTSFFGSTMAEAPFWASDSFAAFFVGAGAA